jgi:hypothetical protein
MGKCCSSGKKYKHKPTGKMIKDIKRMAPGKKIGGGMVYPMSATVPFGLGSTLASIAKSAVGAAKTVGQTLTKTSGQTSRFVAQTNPNRQFVRNTVIPARNIVNSNPTVNATALKNATKNLDKDNAILVASGKKPSTIQMQSMNEALSSAPSVVVKKPVSTLDKLKTYAETASGIAGLGYYVGSGISQAVNAAKGKDQPQTSTATINPVTNPSTVYEPSKNPDIGYVATPTKTTSTKSGGSNKKTVNKNTYNITITNNNQKGGRGGGGRRMMDGRPMARRPEYQPPPPSYEKVNQNAKIYGSMT